MVDLQCPQRNRITLCQLKSDNNNRIIQLTDVFCVLYVYEMYILLSLFQLRVKHSICKNMISFLKRDVLQLKIRKKWVLSLHLTIVREGGLTSQGLTSTGGGD